MSDRTFKRPPRNKVAFCALRFVFFDFLPVSLHYADLRFVLDGAPSEQLLYDQTTPGISDESCQGLRDWSLCTVLQCATLHPAQSDTLSPLFRFIEAMLALPGDH